MTKKEIIAIIATMEAMGFRVVSITEKKANKPQRHWKTDMEIRAGLRRVEKTVSNFLGVNDAWVVDLKTNRLVFDPDMAQKCRRANGGTADDRWANAQLRREVRSALADLRRQQKAARKSRREALAVLKKAQKAERVLSREIRHAEKQAERLEKKSMHIAWTWEEAEAQRKAFEQAAKLREVIEKKAAAVEAAQARMAEAEDIFLGVDAEKRRVDVRVEETLYTAWAMGLRGIKEAPPSDTRPAFVVSFAENTEAVA